MEPIIFSAHSLSTSCRICLETKSGMISIFQIRDSLTIYEKVMTCSDVIILKEDNYPDRICDECLNELDIASRFKQKTEESDKILKRHLVIPVNVVKQELYDSDNCSMHHCGVSPSRETTHSGFEEDVKSLQFIDRKEEKNVVKFKIRKKLSNRNKKSRKNIQNLSVLSKESFNQNNFTKEGDCIELDSLQKVGERNSRKKTMKIHTKQSHELKCETCNLLCQNKWVLKVHMRTHSGERPFQCDLCLKRFVSNSNMRMHKRLTHDDNKQVCSECGKSFSCLTYLKRHLVIHFDVKPYGCTICEKRFTTKSYLKEHIARHRGDKRFFCEICGSKFISVVNLKQHMLVHGVQKRDFKRHQCTFCDYKTTGKVDLARHIRKHTGEKPFRCPHDGCQSAFSGKASLNLHIRIHTGEKPYLCSECPAKFSRGDKFKNHMLKKHNITDVGPSKRSKLVIRELAEAAELGSLLPIPMDILKMNNNKCLV